MITARYFGSVSPEPAGWPGPGWYIGEVGELRGRQCYKAIHPRFVRAQDAQAAVAALITAGFSSIDDVAESDAATIHRIIGEAMAW